MVFSELFNIIAFIIGIYAISTAILNLVSIRKNSLSPNSLPAKDVQPKVSVLIPVRNEELIIEKCVKSLISQTYQNYEILLLDDNSTDRTWEILCFLEKRYQKVRIIKGEPLRQGWNGKNFALHQLAEASEGELLLITDADTTHKPESIAFAEAHMVHRNVDFISGYPRILPNTGTVGMILSVMFLNLLLFNPVWIYKFRSVPFFSLTLGQYICMRRETYTATGGYSAIPDILTDDIHIGRLLSAHGYRQLFIDAGKVVRCTMYDTSSAAFNGLTKCVVDFFDKKIPLLLLLLPLFFTVIILPSLQFLYLLAADPGSVSLLSYTGVAFLLAGWVLILNFQKFPLRFAVIYPFTFFLVIIMAVRGIFAVSTHRGFQWKNRIVK